MDNITENPFIISTENLTFAYNGQPVLNHLNLQVPGRSIFGFLGPNGAGKSTTIKALLGLLKVKPGMIHIFNKELNSHRLDILQRTGATIEVPSLYDHLSARKNVEITRRLRGNPAPMVDEVIETVGLTADSDRYVGQFSTGMKQRLSLALALLHKPDLLILDEPINGLDPEGIREMRNLLLRINQEQGCTIFLSSHILDEVEKICSHVAIIHLGKIIYQGETSGLKRKNGSGGVLTLTTSDNPKCLQIMSETHITSLLPGAVSVSYQSQEDIASIIRNLVDAGIGIYAAKPEDHRLEESFFELLKQGSEA